MSAGADPSRALPALLPQPIPAAILFLSPSLRGKMIPEELEKEIQRAKAEVRRGGGQRGASVGCWVQVLGQSHP